MGSSREGDERLCERAAWEFGTQVTTVALDGATRLDYSSIGAVGGAEGGESRARLWLTRVFWI